MPLPRSAVVTTVGIIGSAGRKSDQDRLTVPVYELIREALRAELARLPRPWDLVSGGAAWCDHVAVDLFLSGEADSLTLHLPAAFILDSNCFVRSCFDGRSDAGRTADHYHRLFSKKLLAAGKESSFFDLAAAITEGARVFVYGGFHARNIPVGKVDVLLAATFGRGAVPADGGTAHTWANSPAPKKVHIPIEGLVRPAPAQLPLRLIGRGDR
jgi:hypothetical protein